MGKLIERHRSQGKSETLRMLAERYAKREPQGEKEILIVMDESHNLSPAEWDKEFVRLHVERENRLAAGQSSPTGWPMERVKKFDDGITIPERRANLRPPRLPYPHAGWLAFLDEPEPVEGDFLTLNDPWWLLAIYGLTITAIVVFVVLYFMGVI